MSHSLSQSSASQLADEFNDASDFSNHNFNTKNLTQRIEWAYQASGGRLALVSSFGVQSILLIDAVQETGLDIPVLSIDVEGDRFDRQREYRQALQGRYPNMDLRIIPVANEGGKKVALATYIADHGVAATLSGLRADQTQNRQDKGFIIDEGGSVTVNPILDWPQAKADYYIQQFEPHLRHPDFQPGVRSKGGAVLAANEEKTECGLWL